MAAASYVLSHISSVEMMFYESRDPAFIFSPVGIIFEMVGINYGVMYIFWIILFLI